MVEPKSIMLNIYDLHAHLTALNSWTLRFGIGGFFHVGLEVFDQEICFCGGEVLRHRPRDSPPHVYRQSVDLGTSPLTKSEIFAVIHRLEAEFPAYNLVTNNCIHFVASLAKNLELKALPRRFFLLTDSLGVIATALGGTRIFSRRSSTLKLRPQFVSRAAYGKPGKFEFSLVLDRKHCLTYVLPEGEDFLLTAVEDSMLEREANLIGVPRGHMQGRATLKFVNDDTILLSTEQKTMKVLLNRPFLLQSLICTIRPMLIS